MQSVPIPILSPGRVRRALAVLWVAAMFCAFAPDVSAQQLFQIVRADGNPFQNQSAEEGNRTITFRIYSTFGGFVRSPTKNAISVSWQTVDRSGDPARSQLQIGSDYAVPNVDYIPASGSITINQNDPQPWRDFTITLLDDAADPQPEFNKDIFVRFTQNTLSPTTGNPATTDLPQIPGFSDAANDLASGGMASVTILDNDQPGGALDRAWNLDNNFGTVPPYNPLPGANDTVNAVAIDFINAPFGSPRTLIGGDFTAFNTRSINRIARINFDGSMDTTFNPGLGANNFVSTIAVNANLGANFGKIILGGGFTSMDGTSRNGLARLTSTGALDASFNPGAGFNGVVRSVVIQPDDKIVVGGQFTLFNGVSRTNVARLNADGTLDLSFDPGLGADGAVYAVALQGAGIVIGGDFATVGGVARSRIALLRPNGTVDPAFDPGTGADGTVFSTAVQSDGKVVLGGAFSTVNVSGRNGIARLNTDGSLDTTFNPGTGANGRVSAIALDASSRPVIVGAFTSFNGTARTNVARLLTSGVLDTGFMDLAYNQSAGPFNSTLGSGFNYIINAGVPVPTPWNLVRTGPATFLNAVAIQQSDGNILVGGNFTDFGAAASLLFNGILPASADGNFFSGNYIPQNLTLSDPQGPSLLRMNQTKPRKNVARLIGRSSPGAGNLEFISPTYSVTEGAGPALLKLQRVNSSDGRVNVAEEPVGVSYTTSDGTATKVDYTGKTNVIVSWKTLFNGSPSGSRQLKDAQTRVQPNSDNSIISLVINKLDTLPGPDRTVHIDLSAPTGTPAGIPFLLGGSMPVTLSPALGFQNSAVLTIVDADFNAGRLSFSATNYAVLENAGVATITVSRTGGSVGVVTVQYNTSPATNGPGVTAATNTDYTAVSGTLTFLTGETNKTFTVPLINNTIVQPDRTVFLNLTNVTGGASILGFPTNQSTLLIIDDDFAAGKLTLDSGSYSVMENGGYATIQVLRRGGSVGAASALFYTTNQNAISGNGLPADYTGVTNTLTWGTGDSSPRIIKIPIINNQLVDGPRTFGITLTNFVGSTNGMVTSAVVTIVDDDRYGTVQFISPDPTGYSVAENGGKATITVVRTGGSGGSVKVDFKTRDNTATNGVDYATSSGTLTMPPGVTSATFDVPITDNSIASQPNKFLDLVLTNAFGGVTGSETNVVSINGSNNAKATLTIIDDESFNIPAGSLDVLFTPGTGPNGVVQTVARQSNGQLVIGGDFTEFNNVVRNRIARLNSNGTLDATFLSTQTGTDGTVRNVLVQPNGHILVGGAFTTINNTNLQNLARLNTDGSVDSAFNPGTGPDNAVNSLALDANNNILVVGDFASFNGVQANFIVRLDTNGVVDTTFNTGTGANGRIVGVAIQPVDQKIIVVGDFTTINGATNANHIARLNPDGSVDPTFFSGVLNNANGANDSVHSVALQSDGKIVIGGLFTQINGTNNLRYARLLNDGTSDGQLDSGFTPGDANDVVNAIAIQPDGKIILVGDFTTCNGVTRNRITRLKLNGDVDPTINFGAGANNVINAALVQPNDGMIVIGGGFTAYDGVPINYVARLNGGSLGGSGRLEFTSANFLADEKGGTALITVRRIGGTFGTVSADYLTSNGTALASANYGATSGVLTFGDSETIRTFNISLTNDFLPNPDRTVNLALFNFTNSVPTLDPTLAGNQTNSVLTIVNDDAYLGFAATNYSVAENVVGGFATITVNRAGGATRPASVRYATSDGTASSSGANPKYVDTSGLLNFAAGQSVASFNIPILNEAVVEGDSTVKLTLSNLTGDVVAGFTNATLTIIDDDTAPGNLQFSSATYGVDEAAGSVTITVVRTNGTLGRVSVNFATSDGTGLAGTDYGATNGTLSFANGQRSRTFTVPISINGLSTNNTTVNLALSTPTGGASLGTLSTAVLTITNNDLIHGNFVFSSANYTAFKNNPTVAITVNRIGAGTILGTNGTVSVMYSITNGTAIAGRDYTNSIGHPYVGTLSWPDGDGAPKTFLIDLLDPSPGAVDGDRMANLRLSAPTGGASLGATNTAVLTIQDYATAPGEFNFAQSGFSGLKNGGPAPITITRTKGKTGLVSVDFFTTDGTAVNPLDYTTNFTTVSFTNNQTSATVLVGIVGNQISTGDKILNLTLSNPVPPVGGPTLGTNIPTATLTIIDDVPPAGSGDGTFTPGAGANAPIHALGLRSDGQLVIGGDFTAYDGLSRTNVALLLATGALDTNFNAGTVKLGAATGSVRAVGVQADNKVVMGGFFDTINGVSRNYIARLNTNGVVDLSFNPGTGANNPVHALAIQNNGLIVVGGAFTAVNGATRNFVARLLANGSVDPAFNPNAGANIGPDAAVRAVAVDNLGRVLIGGDFVSVNGVASAFIARLNTDGTLDASFNPGASLDGSVRSIAIQIDGKVLIGGLFTHYGVTSRNFVARLNADGTLDASFDPGTGTDNYVNSVTLQPDGKVVLGGGFTLLNGMIQNRIARLTTLGAVDPSINFGSGANNDVDALVIQPNGAIVLGGEFTQFGGVTNNYIARLNGGTNFGSGTFGFSAAAYSVYENAGSLTVTVERTGGASNAVSLTFTNVAGGTAVAGVHYTATNGTLTFLPGETTKTFVLPILDDFPAATNIDRTVNLLLANLTPSSNNPTFGQNTAVVTIRDNESVIGFSAATYNVIETAGVASITLTRSGGTNDAVSVRLATTDGTAVSGVNYTGVTNTLNFVPGQTSATTAIPLLDNLIVNGDITVNLSLTSYTGSALPGVTNAVLTILDDEFAPGVLSFSAGTYAVNETVGGTNVTITVRRTNGKQGPVSVQYATSNGTAVSGVNYTNASGTLSWADGDSTPKTFTVGIKDDLVVNAPRTVNLTLSNPTGTALLGSPTTAVLTIFDNDLGLQFSQTNYTVLENAGRALITVYRPDASAGPVTVNYAASAGTAAAGVDFTAVSGTLTFGPGVTNQTFTVPILDNPAGYTNTTINLALSVPTGGATISATRGTAVLTIIDVASGAVDLSFGATLGANGPVYSLAFMTNGQVVLGGDFTAMNSVPINRVARLNTDGTTDLGFNPGLGANGTVYAVAVQTNNNAVILGGAFTTVGGFNRGRIARLNANGFIDFFFNPGTGADSTVYAVGIDTNGFILVGGSFTNVNGTSFGGIARLTAFGAVDGTFNPGTGANGTVRALSVDGFNRVIIAGDFTLVNGTGRTRIARLNSDGTLDATFNPGLGADATIYSVKVTPTGKILVAGAFTTFNGSTKYGITQLNANGTLDAGFNAGIGANGVVTAVEIETNGKIMVVGDFTTFNGVSNNRFVRLNPDGSLDGTFTPSSGANGIVNAVTVLRQPVPPVINLGVGAGGQGSQTNVFDTGSTAGTITVNYDMLAIADDMRVYYNGVLIFDTGFVSNQGTFTVNYGPGPSTLITVIMNEVNPPPITAWSYTITIVPSASPGAVPDRVVIGGDFSSVNGTPRDRIAQINNDGSLDTTYGMGPSAPVVLALGINSNPALLGKTVAGGNFSVINGVDANNIVRLNLDGSVDLNFNPGTGANGQVNTLAVQPDGKVIIGGYFTSVNGTARNYIARLNANGSLDATFDPGIGANNPIYAVALQPNGKILVGGLFTSYNTTARNFLTRLNSDGTVDASFNPSQGPSDVVRAIAVQSDGNIVIGGDFTVYDGVSRSHLARLLPGGGLDPSFDPNAGVDGMVTTVKIDPAGNIVAGGSFTLAYDLVSLMSWNAIARFTSAGTVDASFNPGLGFNAYVSGLAVQPLDGKLVAVGGFTSFDGVPENRVVRLNFDGSLDTTINFGAGADNYVAAAQLQSDGKIVIGGAFTSVDNVPRAGIARLNGGANTIGGGVFEFSSAKFTVNENGQAVAIAVIRRGVLTGPASVAFTTSDGTATAGANYTNNTPITLNFANGQTSANVVVGIIDDAVTNVDRTVVLSLSNPSPGADVGNVSTATLTIVDDDSLLVFGTPSYSVAENGGPARITVNRLGGVANAVSVQYATSDGTAVAYPGAGPLAGFSYTNILGTLTWAAGDRSPKSFTVGIIDDLLTNGNRTINLSLANANNVTVGQPLTLSGATNATLTIVDNEFGPGVLGFATNAFFVAEGNNPAITTYNFNVVRASGSTGPVRVNYTTVNGTALAGSKYVAASGAVIFGSGELVKTISVSVIGNTIVDGNQTFSLVLSNPTGGATLGQNSAVVTIVDDDGVVQFSSATFSAIETNGVARITVNKTPSTSGTVRVNFATSSGTAVAGVHYLATNGTLVFGPGTNSLTFDVPLLDDLKTEGDVTVNLRLSNLVGLGFLGQNTNAVLTIHDNDTGLQFSAAAYTVTESAGSITITVQRVGNSTNTVGVSYGTSNGSATSGRDYTAQNGTLTFGPGVTNQSFTIPIIDNTVVDGNRTVNLILSLPTNGAFLGSQNTAVLTITDNDTSFDFTAGTYAIPENVGSVNVIVRRNGVTGNAASVVASTSDGTGVAGVNYTARNVTLNFGAGVTSQTFTIPILNDGQPNGDQTVNLALSNPLTTALAGSAVLGATNTAVLTIQEVDTVVQLSAAIYSFSEGSSNAVITVQRRGITNSAATVTLTTTAGTATAGVDYLDVVTNLAFAAGVTNLTVAIPFREDLLLEADETVNLTLSNPSAGVSLSRAAAVLRLVDNDRIGSLDSAFDPGSGANGIVYAVARQTDGKALIGGDFTAVNGTNRSGVARLNADGTLDLTFNPGAGVNGPVRAVAVDSQGNVMMGGLFTAVNGFGYTNLCRLLPDGTVDSGTFSDPGINASGAVLALAVDGNDDVLIAGGFTSIGGFSRNGIARISGTGGSLDLSFDPGTGANAAVNAVTIDLTGNVLIGGFFDTVNGASRGGVARLLATGALDPLFNPAMSAGSVIYSLGVQTNGFVVLGGDFNTVNGVGRTNIARLIIDGTNDGLIDLAFDPGAGVNSLVRSLAIDLNGHVLLGGDFITVNNTNRNGIARLGTDGSLDPDLAVSTTGSFDPGIGAGGTVYAIVAQPDGKALAGGNFPTMDGVNRSGIARLNGNQGRLQFSSPAYAFAKHAPGAATVTVNRVGGSSGTISVSYLTADGSATTNSPDADYFLTAGTLTLPPGVTSTNIFIPLVVNSVVQTNETFGISLNNPTGAATLGTPTNAVVTILNDNASFSFTTNAYTVLESGVFAPITVTRTGDLTGTNFVAFTTSGGTAISAAGPNQDYSDATQVLTFLPAEASKTISILINDNSLVHTNPTVSLTLSAPSNPTGGATLGLSAAVLTIIDNDVRFDLSQAAYAYSEGITNAVITVTRTGNTNANSSVFFSTSDLSPAAGAAQAGRDYTPVARTLNFAPGQTSTNVLVPIIHNNLPTGSLVVNLALSGESTSDPVNPNGTAYAGQRTATLTIMDIDVGFSFSSPTVSVGENSGPAVVTITRGGDASQAVSVTFGTSNGSARAGFDYVARNNVTVAFAAGQTSRPVSITIINNSLADGDRTVNLNLSGGTDPLGGVVTLGPSAVLTILDDDVGFGFALANFSVNEGAGSVGITVNRSGNTNVAAAVNFATSDGTATVADGKYGATNGTLNFGPGVVSQTFSVAITNEIVVEGDTFLNLALSGGTNPTAGGAVAYGQKTATLTIVDNDMAFSFSAADYSVSKSGGAATITIVRTGDTNTLASVTFMTADGTATSPLKYTGRTNTVAFQPGDVSQTVSIPIINNLFADGNKTVLLNLSSPATTDFNGTALLGSIPTATLTIINGNIVTIVPDSFVLTAESFRPANNGIDPNETVTVAFALRNNGNVPTENLKATLLTTGGVTSPSPSTAVSYGALLPGGSPATNSFTFTAIAAQVLNATFQLQDGTTNLGTVSFSIQMGGVASFTNQTRLNVPGSLTVPSSGPASLYPSPIVVSNLSGVVNKVVVRLNRLTHPWPADINVLLVSPTGQKVLAMANAGAGFSVTNITLNLDDAAALPLPENAQILTGGYSPTNYLPANVFPAPAPAGPYATALSACNGFDPNGTWSLYVLDDTAGDNGFIQGGWTLTLYTVNPTIDLALSLTNSPNPVVLGNRVTYSTTITNQGPFTATGVLLTNTLPAGATFISASSQQGICTYVGGQVVCTVGSMTNGASVTVTIIVAPTIPGVNNSSAVVAASQIELNPADNRVTTTTQVNGAALSSTPGKGMFSLSLLGENGKTFVIEASADLSVWTPVSTNTVVDGSVLFTDKDAASYPRRFYRAIER